MYKRATALTIASLLLLLATGCSRPQTTPAPADLSAEVKRLEARVASLEAENQRFAEQADQLRADAAEHQTVALRLQEDYQKVLASPGYEAAIRLVYKQLHAGDYTLLKSLIPRDKPFEAGISLGGKDGYKPFPAGSELDLKPYAEWARGHDPEAARYEVLARYPGYALAFAFFPDGTRFTIFFDDWQVTKVQISDQPFELT